MNCHWHWFSRTAGVAQVTDAEGMDHLKRDSLQPRRVALSTHADEQLCRAIKPGSHPDSLIDLRISQATSVRIRIAFPARLAW